MSHPSMGIAGPSCSGKSTVAALVAAAFGAALLRLDDHWIRQAPRETVAGFPSYERPDAYDDASLLLAIRKAAASGPVVAEGFLLLSYPPLHRACSPRFFLDVPHEELVWRRLARIAAGGDPAWGSEGGAAGDRGWLAHGRGEWERFGAAQARLPGVVVLDGTRAPGAVASDIVSVAVASGWMLAPGPDKHGISNGGPMP